MGSFYVAEDQDTSLLPIKLSPINVEQSNTVPPVLELSEKLGDLVSRLVEYCGVESEIARNKDP
ncbi:MAG: hypothetical protein N3E44_06400 [Candidatus Bathyarchaeota archaeon]|nr:hypothetical protein [Candidatus Bathyarchaeota archaeon]